MKETVISALIAERERCAKAIEALMSPESGPEYGMSTDEQRREIRSHNSCMRVAAACVRGLVSVSNER